ncbi:hypothetical protein SLEP1_g52192 [Rubroshorea leprosula]|uniref:Reverse transcriptase Ty1/copia-type domain-containing protein n=1 Tax=Rubroshorea leprosula TaxID=152421 RepID=A0AAV5M7T8_9ROSI|nr:hypothetical protein SLEP1_g52192 [Rubroshorea leprosula]
MAALIESQDMQGFLDGECVMLVAKITPTNSTDAEGPKEVPNLVYISWRRSDHLLRGWITGTLSEEVLGIVVGLTTSREVWDALQEAYAKDSQEREFNLTQAMTTLQKGLGQGYENFVTTMLKPPVPPYQEVTNGNQNKRKGNSFNKFNSKGKGFFQGNGANSTYNSASASYFSHAGNKNVGSNFTRNQPNNFNKQKVEAQNPIMESAVKCQICGKLNHTALKCFNRFNHSYQEDDIPKALAAITIDDNQELEWHPDTGASVHVTGNSSKLNSLKHYHGRDGVMRANSGSCSRLYRQKFEDRSLARAEKRRKAGSGFEAGLSDLGGVLIPSRVTCREDLWGLKCKGVRFERNPSSYKGLSGSFKPPLFLLVESVEEILECLKACLVAKGFHQIASVDFSETFSPVVEAGTIRTILAIATSKQWQIRQLDVKNAFLHGYLNEPVYMEQPPGFLDPKFPTHLSQEFAIKDLGWLNFFLGIEVHYTSLGLILSQSKYALNILSRAQMKGCNSISTPMALKAHSSHSSNDAFHDLTHYRSIVGTLQYLTFTRPDLSFAVNYVCQFMNIPTIENYQTIKRILRYVNGTLNYGLQIPNQSSLDLYAFPNDDWAGCSLTRHSTSGYCTFLGSNRISWCAKKQPAVAHSSAEAEYRSMASTTAEIT